MFRQFLYSSTIELSEHRGVGTKPVLERNGFVGIYGCRNLRVSKYRAITISMILPLPSYEKEKLAAGQDMFFCCGSLAAAGKSSLVELTAKISDLSK